MRSVYANASLPRREDITDAGRLSHWATLNSAISSPRKNGKGINIVGTCTGTTRLPLDTHWPRLKVSGTPKSLYPA